MQVHLQGCNDPCCVQSEVRLHRSNAVETILGPARALAPDHQLPLRGTAWALTPTPSVVGHVRTTVRRSRLPGYEPTTPSILSNDCIASSLVW
ncbi:hypothetical protein MTO96_050192 [Rhipicephalus appendiculatus]